MCTKIRFPIYIGFEQYTNEKKFWSYIVFLEICIFRSNQDSFFIKDNGFFYVNSPTGIYLLIVSNSINFSQNNNCSIVDDY